jgi:hypothetical protein
MCSSQQEKLKCPEAFERGCNSEIYVPIEFEDYSYSLLLKLKKNL